jgi:hypothetical protein
MFSVYRFVWLLCRSVRRMSSAEQIQNSLVADGRGLPFALREAHVEVCAWRRGWEAKREEEQVPANGLWNKVTDKGNRLWTQFQERRYSDGKFPSILHDSYSFRRNYALLDEQERALYLHCDLAIKQDVPGGEVSILGGHSIGHSKQCICTCVLFRTVSEIMLFHCTVPKIVDKKEILRTVSNTSIYCSSDKVDTVYLV